jgi:DNA-binding GntR family transcriptional regulator
LSGLPAYHLTVDSKSASVLRALRSEIISGVLPGGARLKEDVLATRFDVSRVPVREALRQLESEGFVVAEKFKGVTVAERSTEVVVELMQVRRGLEVLAAQLAAQRNGGEQAAELRAVVSEQRSAGQAGHIDELPPLIREFHRLVARASGNGLLETMIDRLLDQTAWGFEQEIAERVESSLNDHGAVAAAILAGSPVQAGLLMDEHILKDEAIYRRSSVG